MRLVADNDVIYEQPKLRVLLVSCGSELEIHELLRYLLMVTVSTLYVQRYAHEAPCKLRTDGNMCR